MTALFDAAWSECTTLSLANDTKRRAKETLPLTFNDLNSLVDDLSQHREFLMTIEGGRCIGKTWLARHLAERLADQFDWVLYLGRDDIDDENFKLQLSVCKDFLGSVLLVFDDSVRLTERLHCLRQHMAHVSVIVTGQSKYSMPPKLRHNVTHHLCANEQYSHCFDWLERHSLVTFPGSPNTKDNTMATTTTPVPAHTSNGLPNTDPMRRVEVLASQFILSGKSKL